MIEEIVLNYLSEALRVPARMEEQEGIGAEYVLVEKTGGGGNEYLKHSTVAIKSISTSLHKAAELNETVEEEMRKIISLDDVTKCELNSDYNYTDTKKKKYRYQAIFDITHY